MIFCIFVRILPYCNNLSLDFHSFLFIFSLQVNKFVAEHPEKRYNVIGTAALVDKMKVRYDAKRYSIVYNRIYSIKSRDLCILKPCLSMTRSMANLWRSIMMANGINWFKSVLDVFRNGYVWQVRGDEMLWLIR